MRQVIKFGAIAALAILAMTGCIAAAPVIVASDEDACALMSDAIGIVNEQNYASVAAITADNDETSIVAGNAAYGAGEGKYEGTGNGAKSSKLKAELKALWESWDFGSELINFEISPNSHDPSNSLYESTVALDQVATSCSELGFPLTNSAFNFAVPAAHESDSSPRRAQPLAANGSTIPAGFEDGGGGVAYQSAEGECDYLRCVHYQLYAYESCPTRVYIEGNTVDADGTIYGIANDAMGPMKIGDDAVATLTVTDKSATAVQITKVDCY